MIYNKQKVIFLLVLLFISLMSSEAATVGSVKQKQETIIGVKKVNPRLSTSCSLIIKE